MKSKVCQVDWKDRETGRVCQVDPPRPAVVRLLGISACRECFAQWEQIMRERAGHRAGFVKPALDKVVRRLPK